MKFVCAAVRIQDTLSTLVHASWMFIRVSKSPSLEANRLCACPAFFFSSSLYGCMKTVSEERRETAVITSTTHLTYDKKLRVNDIATTDNWELIVDVLIMIDFLGAVSVEMAEKLSTQDMESVPKFM